GHWVTVNSLPEHDQARSSLKNGGRQPRRPLAAVPVIDSHCHVWRVDLLRAAWRGAPGKIDKTLRVRDLLSAAKKVPLAGVVLIEAGTSDEDNRWLSNVASRNARVLGFVTHADPLDRDLEERLDRWRAASKFRGVRFRLEGIHDADFPTTQRFMNALQLIRDK